jgi:hypothetical protein
LVVALTFAGKMTLFAAIAADVGIMLIVTLNGIKLLPAPNQRRMIESVRSVVSICNSHTIPSKIMIPKWN